VFFIYCYIIFLPSFSVLIVQYPYLLYTLAPAIRSRVISTVSGESGEIVINPRTTLGTQPVSSYYSSSSSSSMNKEKSTAVAPQVIKPNALLEVSLRIGTAVDVAGLVCDCLWFFFVWWFIYFYYYYFHYYYYYCYY
jgi:hypothetical protein